MIRVFVLLSGLMLAVLGIILLLWLLWILWKYKTVEPEPPAIEREASKTEGEWEPLPSEQVALTPDVETGQSALDSPPNGANEE